jgi:hypothetical protein
MKPTEIINAEFQKLVKDSGKFVRLLNVDINKKI